MIDMILEVLIGIVIVGIAAYLTINYIGSSSQSTKVYDISSGESNVLTNAQLPWNMKKPSALRFAIYINGAPRTVAKVDDCDVATATGISNRLIQSCDDYSYNICQCSGKNDCGNCTLQSNYLSKLLWMGTSVELWASGYTSESDRPFIPTLLKIKTANESNMYFETIPLPAIPLQKWTVVTIVQEGRRIDVFYGAKAVTGVYLKYPPVPAYKSDMWYAGGLPDWSGTIGLFSTTLTARTSQDVEADVANLVDSSGLPYAQNSIDLAFDMGFVIPCFFGTCGSGSSMPVVQPPTPFAVYASNVS